MKLRSLIQQGHSSYKGINWFGLFTDGNRKAFSHYFEVLYPSLFHNTRKMLGDPEGAKKIVICALVNSWRNREDFTNLEQLKLFVRDTIREHCTIYRLSLARDPGTSGVTDRSVLFDQWGRTGPHMERIHKEILAEMFQKLELLPEDCKWVLHHAIAGRKSRAQLAEEWRISENAAAIRKSRAFKALLSLMSDGGSGWL